VYRRVLAAFMTVNPASTLEFKTRSQYQSELSS
jgi:hypothetical protein